MGTPVALCNYEEKDTHSEWRLLVSKAPDTLSLFLVLTATCCWEGGVYSRNDWCGLPSVSLPVGIDIILEQKQRSC